jgi:hypothetical protein
MRVEAVIKNTTDRGENGSDPRQIAKLVYRAATDGRDKQRYGGDRTSTLLTNLRRFLPLSIYRRIILRTVK